MSTITMYRGDTRTVTRTVKIAGVAPNIAGWSFILTVDHRSNPGDNSTLIEAIIGTITDGPNGQVSFETDGTATATVGRFFYDIEVIDAAGKKSTVRGEYVVLQDITKGTIGQTWVPDPDGVDFTPYPVDGTEFWRGLTSKSASSVNAEYSTQDGTKIVEIAQVATGQTEAIMFAQGATSRFFSIGPNGIWELTGLFFISSFVDDPAITIGASSSWWQENTASVQYAPDSGSMYAVAGIWDWDTGSPLTDDDSGFGPVVSSPPFGWFVYLKVRLDLDNGVVSGRAWVQGDAEPGTWNVETGGANVPHLGAQVPSFSLTQATNDQVGIAEFTIERVG